MAEIRFLRHDFPTLQARCWDQRVCGKNGHELLSQSGFGLAACSLWAFNEACRLHATLVTQWVWK